jgi:hypothetical protein
MKHVHWPAGLADLGALACAGALFAAMALEVPARTEPGASDASLAARSQPAPSVTAHRLAATAPLQAGR